MVAFWAFFCTVMAMQTFVSSPSAKTVSVTDAASRGVSGLVKEAELGSDIIVERHGRPVAAVIGMEHLHALRVLEDDVRSAALVLSRTLSDTGRRTSLDDAIRGFGFDRAELEAELAADSAAGRE